MRNYPYLNDVDFLMSFAENPIQEQYVKLTVLNFAEKPLKSIEGMVQSGSINVDGKSSVRRTANLTVLVDNQNAEFMKPGGLFSMNKKIKIEIGLKNISNKYSDYPILWFPQGVFVIMGISLSNSTSGLSVSLQLKDKMVFLNGECGGTIPASTIFHEYEILNPDTGDYIIEKPLITQIIRELVNHFGGEQLGKILISDIDNKVKKVMKWKHDYPLYRYNDQEGLYFFQTTKMEPTSDNGGIIKSLKEITVGMDAGFVYSDFYYPGELSANAGDSVCTILDKIKSTLGNFEYYYDLDGNFVFQEIKNYLYTTKATVDLRELNVSLPNTITPQNYVIDKGKGNALYVFNNKKIITSVSSSPQYGMIKNDFVVWGMREGATGQKLPIRYHLALDKKPEPGNIYTCWKKDVIGVSGDVINHAYVKSMLFTHCKFFPKVGEDGRVYEQENISGDSPRAYIWNTNNKRYIDEDSSELKDNQYYPPRIKEGEKYYSYYHPLDDSKKVTIKTTDWRSELFMQGVMGTRHGIDSNYYFTELTNEWPKLYDLGEYDVTTENFKEGKEPGFKSGLDYTGIDFYLDFIDSDSAISEFNIENIGRRTKIVNNDKINCVFETEIPDVVFISTNQPQDKISEEVQNCHDRQQNFTQISGDIYDGMIQGGSQNSAYNEIRNLLYQHTQYNDGISLQVIPMYFLQPNTRITVHDNETNIYGDYIINSFSVPLDVNGTMSLSCSKALSQI